MTERKRAAEPTITQDPATGKWGFVLDAPADPVTGKRRQVRRRGLTKAAAKSELTKAKNAIREGTHVARDDQSLGAYLNGYWLPLKRTKLTPSTQELYARLVRVHIEPALGSIKVQALTARDLDTFYAEMLDHGRRDGKKGGLSVSTVIKLHALLHHALKDAVKKKIITHNVADAADPPSATAGESSERTIWTAEQLGQFLDFIESTDDPYAPAFRVAALTGLRRGELLGLAWEDVDLDGGTITVRRQLIAINRKVSLSETTKTKRKRRVALDPTTVAVLRAQRRAQREQRLKVGAEYRDTGLVFTKADGSWIDPHLFAMAFKRRARAAGLPVIRFHDLRHSHLSMLVKAGRLKAASARAGHSSVSFTLATYAHLAPTEDADAAAEAANEIDAARARRSS